MTTRSLHIATAVIEVGAGVGLLVSPAAAGRLVLDASVDSTPAGVLARVGGFGLLSLGVACWLARDDSRSAAAKGLLAGMTLYNAGAAAVLGWAGIGPRLVGVALWPAVVLHVGMFVWCVACLRGQRGKASFEGAIIS